MSNNNFEADQLSIIFNKQEQFDKSVDESLSKLELDQKIEKKCTAIVHEAVELQRLTNWKWWKDQNKEFPLVEAKEELIDIMFFVVSTAIDLGMSSKDFYQQYLMKYIINVERQRARQNHHLMIQKTEELIKE